MEDGETPLEALGREVYEETGRRVKRVLSELGDVVWVGEDGVERRDPTYARGTHGTRPSSPDAAALWCDPSTVVGSPISSVDSRWSMFDMVKALAPLSQACGGFRNEPPGTLRSGKLPAGKQVSSDSERGGARKPWPKKRQYHPGLATFTSERHVCLPRRRSR